MIEILEKDRVEVAMKVDEVWNSLESLAKIGKNKVVEEEL